MTRFRLLILTLGPPLLIGAVYMVTFSAVRPEVAARRTAAERRSWLLGAAQDELTQSCELAADAIMDSLPANCRVVVRPPFVLAGDLDEAALERLHHETVAPVAAALWRAFFDRKPDRPVTIVALSDQARYESIAADLDGYDPSAYAGYTQRGERRIVLNLATGRGTLSHELCHMLALFDFPGLPEWFDEGLAALHEEADFSEDGLLLRGRPNWRSRVLHDALRRNQLPPLEQIIESPSFRGEGEGLNYALVRSFCEYLQSRGLLCHFYRKFRGASADDPHGIATLCELLNAPDVDQVDRDFRAWLARQDQQ